MVPTRIAQIVASAGLWLALSAFSPSHVECLAPADPGGGWDFTCRSVSKILYDLKLVPEPVQVTNMPGGTGAVAFANVAGKRSDDSNLLVATSTVGITQIAQGRYPGGVDTMRWLAMLGTDVGAILVAKDSPFKTLEDLMDALEKDPGSVVAAGSSAIGGWDHLRLLMLAEKAGISGADLRKIRWVQYDGGGPAVTQMLGGHAGMVLVDLGEIAGFVESGDVRVLAVLGEERIDTPTFKDIPTAKEAGYDVVGYNWRGFYLPGKVGDDAYDGWVDIMHKLYQSQDWQKTAKGHGLIPKWIGGKDFVTFVDDQVQTMTKISKEIGVIK